MAIRRDGGLEDQDLTDEIIGSAIEVHRQLGPGLLECVYEQCLCLELAIRNVPFVSQLQVPIQYKDTAIEACYRLDLLVSDRLIVEVKAVEHILPVHEAQLLTYLRLAKKKVGLLINFNVPMLRDGIRRRVL